MTEQTNTLTDMGTDRHTYKDGRIRDMRTDESTNLCQPVNGEILRSKAWLLAFVARAVPCPLLCTLIITYTIVLIHLISLTIRIMSEVVSLFLGQAGIRVGEKYVEKLMAEHSVNSDGTSSDSIQDGRCFQLDRHGSLLIVCINC